MQKTPPHPALSLPPSEKKKKRGGGGGGKKNALWREALRKKIGADGR